MTRNHSLSLVFYGMMTLLVMMLQANSVLGQTDTLFWFVAPDAVAGLGDSPVTLHLSAGPSGAQVVVDQPANIANFPAITLTVPPNSVLVHDLTSRLSQLENQPPNTIQPYGIRIRSNQPVGVLYEIKALLNAASFTLKGKTALGTRFFVGGQGPPFALGAWVNDTTIPPGTAKSRFDVVATQDSTWVTITPRNNLIGQNSNVPFQRLLMRGQTLACIAAGSGGLQKVTGSLIVSDKPIAVTYSDDAVYDPSYGTCRDMIGDQLVPVQSVGQDYIVGRGILTNGNNSMPDRYYVTSTDTGTVLRINGSPVHSFTSAGETYLLTVYNPSEYIETTKPVYVFHVTGMGCEIGGALLPRINCTGSRQVRFHRYTGDSLFLIAIVENGGQSLFTLNANPALLSASDFSSLPGNQWWVARKNIGLLVPTNGTISLLNSQFNFHAGIISGSPDGDGQPSSNAIRYAYFSDYGLSSNRDLYDTLCRGDAVFIGNRRYDTTGIYIIRYSSTRLCDSTVTLYLTVYPKDTFNLTPVPVQACGSYLLNGRNVTVSGIYTDSLRNRWGCDSLSRIQLTVHPLYDQQIQRSVCDSFYFDGRWLRQSGSYRDTLVSIQGCDSIVRLQLTIGNSYTASERVNHCGPYRWKGMLYNQSGIYTRVIPGPGGCDSLLELQLTVRPVPTATLPGPLEHCLDNGPITLDQGQPAGGTYWGDAVRGNSFEPSVKRDYEVRYIVTNDLGCSDTAILRIRVHDECNAFLYLPDAFIPDDPTRPENRKFSMVAYNILKVDVKVFDRYGQILFESQDPNFGWDGTRNGNKIPSGTYPYLLNYVDAAGKTGLRSGLLHLVR